MMMDTDNTSGLPQKGTARVFWAIVKTMRPDQWTKNFLVFAGLIFSQHLFQVNSLLQTVAAFGLFCLVSSAIYIINDIKDVERDRAHPLKSKRPIASGQLPVVTASVAAMILSLVSVGLAFMLNRPFGYVVLSYFALLFLYSFSLKHIVILDVLTIAIGFVLRAIAGAVVIQVKFSSWLLLCTILLALFIALSKRRHELVLLGGSAHSHRNSSTSKNSERIFARVIRSDDWRGHGVDAHGVCPVHNGSGNSGEIWHLVHDSNYPVCDLWDFSLFVSDAL